MCRDGEFPLDAFISDYGWCEIKCPLRFFPSLSLPWYGNKERRIYPDKLGTNVTKTHSRRIGFYMIVIMNWFLYMTFHDCHDNT